METERSLDDRQFAINYSPRTTTHPAIRLLIFSRRHTSTGEAEGDETRLRHTNAPSRLHRPRDAGVCRAEQVNEWWCMCVVRVEVEVVGEGEGVS